MFGCSSNGGIRSALRRCHSLEVARGRGFDLTKHMAPSRREDLLRSSLEADQQPREMAYSSASFFWVSFLGGPLGAAVWFGLNARRLGRWSLDLPWLVLALVMSLVAIGAMVLLPMFDPETFSWLGNRQNARALMRGSGGDSVGGSSPAPPQAP